MCWGASIPFSSGVGKGKSWLISTPEERHDGQLGLYFVEYHQLYKYHQLYTRTWKESVTCLAVVARIEIEKMPLPRPALLPHWDFELVWLH